MSEASPEFKALEQYMVAFEVAYAANDWNIVAQCFAKDLGWVVGGGLPAPIGGQADGLEAVLTAIKASCDNFDRRFDLRKPDVLEGPTEFPGGFHFTWDVTYSREGVPDFNLQGEEWDFIQDGKLVFHREMIWNGADALEYLQKFDAKLRPAGG